MAENRANSLLFFGFVLPVFSLKGVGLDSPTVLLASESFLDCRLEESPLSKRKSHIAI